ncbi:hypothetical protein ACFQQB_49110 [Nonomuraea rubra]|uniref:hypothetical protein n=1 Tax=Nonomuraea rubra TaxID=46180 RepID=UPI0036232341
MSEGVMMQGRSHGRNIGLPRRRRLPGALVAPPSLPSSPQALVGLVVSRDR